MRGTVYDGICGEEPDVKRKDATVRLEIHPILTDFLVGWVDVFYRQGGQNHELIITSGSEDSAVHSRTSLHYSLPSCAVDIRSWHIPGYSAEDQYREISKMADEYCERHPLLRPGDIDVVLEKDHIHLELQPKRRGP